MSSSDAIISILVDGIQAIASILPLIGTDECSYQVTSALTQGYLYAATTPMSIFGSLGVVISGFLTLIACFSYGNIEGAKILGRVGFEPTGQNLSLIMVESGKGKDAPYIIETRINKLIKKLNIDKNRITGVSYKSSAWNFKMMVTTALLCAISITPYICFSELNIVGKSMIWVFPVLRAIGGFTTVTLVQLLIQRRIITLSRQHLVKRGQLPERDQVPKRDVEAAGDTKKYQMVAQPIGIVPTWLLLCLLSIVLAATLVGYFGCYSVVQNSTSNSASVVWLFAESILTLIRSASCAWDPTSNKAPPLEITLELAEYIPFPTCNRENEEILQYKVLPLTRSRDFLMIITSFAGLIEPFSNPDLCLYYTLTRKPSKRSVKLGEWILYITVFDSKERTTRIYTQVNGTDTFYSTKPDTPLVDIGHSLLEVEIDDKIDPKHDPVSSNSNNVDSLRKHHRSILEMFHYRLGLGVAIPTLYVIENMWTMKVEDTIGTLQRKMEENGKDWKEVVLKGKEEEKNEESSLLRDYFSHPSIDRERRLLDEKHTEWNARRMEMRTIETKEGSQLETGVEYRIDMHAVEKKPATKSPGETALMLRLERYLMELILLYEVKEWEQLFWKNFKAFLDQIGDDRVEEKKRLTCEWRANCWKRLDPKRQAAVKRLADLVKEKDYDIDEQWASSISEIVEGVESSENPHSISLSKLRRKMEVADDGIRLRMDKEIEDTKFRLKRGLDSGRFDQFWDDDTLFECRYSRSKWLYFSQYFSSAPLEIYLHALKGNKNIIHITFCHFVSDSEINRFGAISYGLPRVTSISGDLFGLQPTLPAIHRDLLFIKYTNNDLITFATEIRLKLDSFSTYVFTDAGCSDIYRLPDRLGNNARVLISFVAPTSGRSLILRLKHSGSEDGPLEVTIGSTIIQLKPSSKSSLTIDDLTLYPIPDPSESDHHLLFEPEVRNDIVIRFSGTWGHGHFLHDVELLDEAGLEYMPHSA